MTPDAVDLLNKFDQVWQPVYFGWAEVTWWWRVSGSGWRVTAAWPTPTGRPDSPAMTPTENTASTFTAASCTGGTTRRVQTGIGLFAKRACALSNFILCPLCLHHPSKLVFPAIEHEYFFYSVLLYSFDGVALIVFQRISDRWKSSWLVLYYSSINFAKRYSSYFSLFAFLT